MIILTKSTISDVSPKSAKTKPKAALALAVARKRASKALANAKQRCDNPKNPDFPNYGALGVQVIFDGVSDLIASIGLPKSDETLDRINPNGNYAHGNVRWANQAVQAANKKAAPFNKHLSHGALVQKAEEVLAARKNRRRVALAWEAIIRAHHRGYFLEHEAFELADHLNCHGVIEANFDTNTVYDCGNPAPAFMHLPALSAPQSRVRIRCEPCERPMSDDYIEVFPAKFSEPLEARGRLKGLEGLDPAWNIPDKLWKAAIEMLQSDQKGICIVGKPSAEALLGGWIEGSLLALASSLAAASDATTAFYPMMTAADRLLNLGGDHRWEYECDPILDTDIVIIPDLFLDCGAWGDFPPKLLWRFSSLIQYRLQRGLKTIVGVQNLNLIADEMRYLILGTFQIFHMPTRLPHEMAPLKFASKKWQVPFNGHTLDSMSKDGALRKLVVHSGLEGT